MKDLQIVDRISEIIASSFPKNPSRQEVLEVERKLRQFSGVDLPVHHNFTEGVYVRIIEIPRGTVLVGSTHRKSHVVSVLMGDITLLTDAGMIRVHSPWVKAEPAGIKRIIVAHTDAVLMNSHPNPSNWGISDLDKLHRELIAPDDDIDGEYVAI